MPYSARHGFQGYITAVAEMTRKECGAQVAYEMLCNRAAEMREIAEQLRKDLRRE